MGLQASEKHKLCAANSPIILVISLLLVKLYPKLAEKLNILLNRWLKMNSELLSGYKLVTLNLLQEKCAYLHLVQFKHVYKLLFEICLKRFFTVMLGSFGSHMANGNYSVPGFFLVLASVVGRSLASANSLSEVRDKSVLYIDLSGTITERYTPGPCRGNHATERRAIIFK